MLTQRATVWASRSALSQPLPTDGYSAQVVNKTLPLFFFFLSFSLLLLISLTFYTLTQTKTKNTMRVSRSDVLPD
jgi:hypothetical protein